MSINPHYILLHTPHHTLHIPSLEDRALYLCITCAESFTPKSSHICLRSQHLLINKRWLFTSVQGEQSNKSYTKHIPLSLTHRTRVLGSWWVQEIDEVSSIVVTNCWSQHLWTRDEAIAIATGESGWLPVLHILVSLPALWIVDSPVCSDQIFLWTHACHTDASYVLSAQWRWKIKPWSSW